MPDKEPKPLVEVKAALANVDVNLNGLEGVANNLIKALSRGLGIFGEPLRRWLDARADRGIANQRFKTIIDLTKNQA